MQSQKYLQNSGHSILWTPPHTPDLQPIELFWAAGKKHAASMAFSGNKIKETINHLREGWYSNHQLFNESNKDAIIMSNYHIQSKQPVKCCKLYSKAIKMANKKFIPMCNGITGTIGSLVVDTTHVPVGSGIPIDMLIVDLTKNQENNLIQ
jgi:hypothetical protein